MVSCVLRSLLVALLFAVSRCRHVDPRVDFDFSPGSVSDAFAVSAKRADVKRPFGGGGVFSSPRMSDDRWKGKRSFTPWAISEFDLKEDDDTGHRSRPHSDEEMNYDFMKRPFGPQIYTRPFASREEKRPFGGNMIFSKPRETGNKPRFGGYLTSRVRREDSWGAAGTKLREISDHRGSEEPKGEVFSEGLERSGEGHKRHRQMSLAPYDDDYKDDAFESNVREEVHSEAEEQKEDSRKPHP